MVQNYGLYNYLATVKRVLDGDTVELEIDLGFNVLHRSSCRLYGINAPELRKADQKVAGIAAKDALIDMIPLGAVVRIESRELDKYGRPLVVIYKEDVSINQWLVDNGHAKPYK